VLGHCTCYFCIGRDGVDCVPKQWRTWQWRHSECTVHRKEALQHSIIRISNIGRRNQAPTVVLIGAVQSIKHLAAMGLF